VAKNTDNAQTCRTCGALVDSEKTNVHISWHKDFDNQVLAIIRKERRDDNSRRSGGGY
jgi:hypothetical protein